MKIATKESEEAFSGETVPLEVIEDERVHNAVVTQSRRQYGVDRKLVEDVLQAYFAETTPAKSIGVKRFTKKDPSEF